MGRPRKAETTTRRMVRLPDHPLAPAGGLFPHYRYVLYESIGPGPHPCYWCGTMVDWNAADTATGKGTLTVDHLDGNPLNDDLANLAPSCHGCNVSRGRDHHIKPGETFKVMTDGRRLRAVERPCECCGDSFLAVVSEVTKGRGRFCSMSCARRKCD